MNHFTPEEFASLSVETRIAIIMAECDRKVAEENRKAEEFKLKRELLCHCKRFMFLVIYPCFLSISYIFT